MLINKRIPMFIPESRALEGQENWPPEAVIFASIFKNAHSKRIITNCAPPLSSYRASRKSLREKILRRAQVTEFRA